MRQGCTGSGYCHLRGGIHKRNTRKSWLCRIGIDYLSSFAIE